ncbi:class I SAM-dependent methyltransferase [Brevundimonas sp. TWP2-3-4b1]|uniref:class I SAM-dependent methyltransferase n=1 Tax=Brevundimonas sp. TWP2-3-4b1 TaxID=2804580 RepID=UPI003CF88230
MSEPHFFPLLRSEMGGETWCLDSFTIDAHHYHASGWAIPIEGDLGRGRILVNGLAPTHASYNGHRSDIEQIYGYLPNAGLSHFVISGPLDVAGRDYVELSYDDPTQASFADAHKNYFIPLSAERFPFPDDARRHRTTGPSPEATFAYGGYTIARKMDGILKSVTGQGLNSRKSILDWGGGCGRVSRYLATLAPDAKITLGDIDADNVAWCAANLPGVETFTLALYPPSPFEDGAFDTVIGNSVFTHLMEDTQFLWLEELRRITTSKAILMVTVHSIKDLMRRTDDPAAYDELISKGFVDRYIDEALTGQISDETYYRASFHTHAYIREKWSAYFEVVEIVRDASNNHQDIVVMRRA